MTSVLISGPSVTRGVPRAESQGPRAVLQGGRRVASDGQTFIPDHRPAGLGCGRPTEISSLATYVPPRLLTNQDLEKLVETTSEWILQRTGIHTVSYTHLRAHETRHD